MKRGRPSSRERVLDAAEALVARQGVSQLTYEALATHTGISRGGILYNFPCKEDLLQALIDRSVSRLHAQARAFSDPADDPAREAPPSGAAYIRALLRQVDEDTEISVALLGAALENRALLNRFRDDVAKIIPQVGMATSRCEQGLLLFFALEGVRLFKMLDLYPLDETQDRALKQWVERLLDETPATPPG